MSNPNTKTLVVIFSSLLLGCSPAREDERALLANKVYVGSVRIVFGQARSIDPSLSGNIRFHFADSTYSYTVGILDSTGIETRRWDVNGAYSVNRDTVLLRDESHLGWHDLPGLHFSDRFTISKRDSTLVLSNQRHEGVYKLATVRIELSKQ